MFSDPLISAMILSVCIHLHGAEVLPEIETSGEVSEHTELTEQVHQEVLADCLLPNLACY